MERNVSLTFDWDVLEDMFTYNITISLRPPLQSSYSVVDIPPWSIELNLNYFMDVMVAITAVNSYCEISSDASTLHYACKPLATYYSCSTCTSMAAFFNLPL